MVMNGWLVIYYRFRILIVLMFTFDRIERKTDMSLADDIFTLLNYNRSTGKIGPGLLAEKPMAEIRGALHCLLAKKHKLSLSHVNDALNHAWDLSASLVKPTCDVLKVFECLKSLGVKIAICTSDSRNNTLVSLKCLGVEHLVDLMVCGDDAFNVAKPAPDNLKYICRQFGTTPGNTIVLG